MATDKARKHSHDEPAVATHDQDVALVGQILSGSLAAWHEFVQQYSRLIYSVVRKQLFDNDEDRVQTIFVDVLHALYKRKLRDYTGRASLSTWLVVVTRGHLLDDVRSRRGRRRVPSGYNRLGPFEKRVFQLYYMELMPYEALLPALNWQSDAHTGADVAAAIHQIEDVVDRRFLDRTGVERTARDTGMGSGRELARLIRVRDSYRREAEAIRPDAILEEREQEGRIAKLRRLVAGLSERDRQVVDLKFEKGWSAAKIDRELGLGGQRRVYAILERVTRQLKRGLASADTRTPIEPEDIPR